MHGKIAALVLLKLIISGNDRSHSTNAPYHMSGSLFSNVNNIQSMISEDQEKHVRLKGLGSIRPKHVFIKYLPFFLGNVHIWVLKRKT